MTKLSLFPIPVVSRELQVTARAPALYGYRTIIAAVSLAVAILVITFSGSAPARVGQGMFKVFAWGGFLLCLWEGARVAADSISGERRQGTLGLLFLTDLRAHDVVLGKFAFVAIRSLALVFPVLPAFALPLLLGGITGGESWRVMLTLLVAVLFALSAGLLCSSRCVGSTAALGATAAVLMLMLVQPALAMVMRQSFALPPGHWTAGPLGMMLASNDAEFSAAPASFWLAGLVSVQLSALMLVGASYFTRRELARVPMLEAHHWWQRWLQPRRGYVAPWGDNSEQSPAVWLAQRTLPGRRMLWTLICLGLALCFASGLLRIMVLAIAVQFFFGVLLKLWVAVVAPQSLHELRKSGALELILCTPLQPTAIVRGQVDTLYEYVMAPALVIAVGFPMVLYAGAVLVQQTDISEPAMMVPAGLMWLMYLVLDLHALGYLGAWHGISSARIEAAVGKTAWYGLMVPWLVFVVPVIGWVTLLFWPVIIISWATKRLNERFHHALIETATSGN